MPHPSRFCSSPLSLSLYVLPLMVGSLLGSPTAFAEDDDWDHQSAAHECAECHSVVHDQWKNGTETGNEPYRLSNGKMDTGTLHANAWTDAIFQEEFKASNEMEMCRRCHMPEAALEPVTKFGVYGPLARDFGGDNESEGITCVSCHVGSDGKIHGPNAVSGLGDEEEHSVVQDGSFTNGALCASCHQSPVFGAFTDTWFEYLDGPYADTETCNSCHMREGGHNWPGGHSPSFLATALTTEIPTRATAGQAVHLQLHNSGSAHSVPTGDVFRAFVVDVSIFDERGQEVSHDVVNIANEVSTPFFGYLEERERIDPIPAGGSTALALGTFEPGRYSVELELRYQLTRGGEKAYHVRRPQAVEGTEEMLVDRVITDLLVCAQGAECGQGPYRATIGGRLYDKWYNESTFDDVFSPGASGGPNGDGTLNDGNGDALSSSGHSYRFKNLFGWDFRGAEGIYGPAYQNKSYVLDWNLMDSNYTYDDLMDAFTWGTDVIPAYGEVLSQQNLEDVVGVIIAMRDGNIVQASDVWALSTSAPKNYTLNSGGNAQRGGEIYDNQCASCHGFDGTAILVDGGGYSLGSFSRQKAYEGWIKIHSGQPGSFPFMDGQMLAGQSRSEQAIHLLDLSAALCDRDAFPLGDAPGSDVPDGDPRCGDYLQ